MFNPSFRKGMSVTPQVFRNITEEKMAAPNNAYYVLTQAHAGLPNSVLFDTAFAGKTTDDLLEGSTNLYYTDARVGAYVSPLFVPYTGATADVNLGAYSLFLVDGKIGIGTASPATGYKLDVVGFINTNQIVNQSTYPSINAFQTASTLQDGSSFTGTDATMSTQYIAVKFTASDSHTMGDFTIRIKESENITNATAYLTGYIYADDGLSPSKPTGSALATGSFVRYGTITSSYQTLSLGTQYTMTSGTAYWLVIKWTATPTGGNIIFDSNVSANMGATSTNGTNWTNTDVQLRYVIRGMTCYGVYGISTNNAGVYGRSTNSYGVYGSSTNNMGVYGSSTNNVGVFGTSANSSGVYGISTNSYGVYGTSTNNVSVYGRSINNYAGYFSRNTATPTSAVPVLFAFQDHASDTNSAFDVRQDGTGAIFRAFDYTSEVFRIDDGGKVGIGTATPTASLDVNSDILRLRTAKTPTSASDTGNAGDICWDADYVYVCVATNTWKRAAISTW